MISKSKIECSLFFLLSIVSVFVYSKTMTDTYIVPKWCYTILFSILTFIIISIKRLCNKTFQLNILTISYIIVAVCTLQAMYGIAQWLQLVNFSGNYGITGSFDNPAGFAITISIGFPFILLCIESITSKFWVIVMYLFALFCVFAIAVSESRSGMISASAIIVIELYRYLRIKKIFRVATICGLFLLLLLGSYFLKRDSANGRLLIWKCTWEMIKDSPVYGHGIGAFRTHYMDYQADYFKQYPNSKYVMLADNVISPFNEYLRIVLSFGVLGLLIVVLGVLYLIFCYYKNSKDEKRMALLSLLGIGVFSVFSYPFTYPFVWVIVCFDIYIVLKGSLLLTISSFTKKMLCVVTILGGVGASYKLYQRMDAEYRWNNIAYFSTNANMEIYIKLMPVLGDNPYFLYNYANALFDKNHLEASLDIALRCRNHWADYDLELLLGSIYKQKNEYDLAESHYRKASFMCPSRFIPLYDLFNLYEEMNDKEKAISIAWQIIDKPVKVQSKKTNQIKNRMKKELGF